MDPEMFAQLMGQYRQMQANPFARSIPGTEYLGGMGQGAMGGGMPGMGQNQFGGPAPDSFGGPNLQQGGQVPTDFAGTPPGLPNLPQDMQGFGFGQTAPEMNVNRSLRENLIKELLDQLQGGMQPMPGMMPGSMPGMGGGMIGGMGGMGF